MNHSLSLNTGLLNILLVEDNPGDVFLISEMLHDSLSGVVKIYTADRTTEAIHMLHTCDIDLALVDLSLPDSLGIESFLKIKQLTKNIPVIILTGLSDSDIAIQTLKEGAQDYLIKGEFKSDILIKSIQYSIERKSVEKRIIASEEKYRQMFYKNPFPAWIYDCNTLEFLEVNDAAIDTYGYEREEFLKLTVKDIRIKEDIKTLMESPAWYRNTEKQAGNILKHKKKNGDSLLVEVTFYEINYMGRTAMQAQINDVTEKIRLEKELSEQQRVKEQQITDAVLSAQEEERKYLGEELHDNINQVLATAKLFLSTALTDLAKKKEFVIKSQQFLGIAMDEIRKLSKQLITPVFSQSGLATAINDMIQNIRETTRINISSDIQMSDERGLPEPLKLSIYRIVQEQVNNVLKHAHASTVAIRITEHPEQLTVTIKDDGVGFDTHLHSNGIGFINMNSRAVLFNGKVDIISQPGKGCILTVELQKPQHLIKQVA